MANSEGLTAETGVALKAVRAPVDAFRLKPVIVLVLIEPFAAYRNCPEGSIAKYPVPALTGKGAPFTAVKAPLASMLKPEMVPSLLFNA